jgi:integrase
MTNLTVYQSDNSEISILRELGEAANDFAAAGTFEDYNSRKANNTNRRRAADLASFAGYLSEKGVTPGDLQHDPEAWRGITWGLVKGFVMWLLNNGFAVSTVNLRLSAIKVYSGLAVQAGTMEADNYTKIRVIAGYKLAAGKKIDEKRQAAGVQTRVGLKKAEPVSLNREQASKLKAQPSSPQGRRDALLMCLMLDHGLRCGEVAGLQVTDFDLKAGELRFYRPKVDKTQTHKMTKTTLEAARLYFKQDAPAVGPVLRGSIKGKAGALAHSGMCEQSITERVKVLGERIGVQGLSAHDLRHYWATQAARNKTPLDRLQDAGGWSSPAMPMRYVEAAKIANEGVNLGTD